MATGGTGSYTYAWEYDATGTRNHYVAQPQATGPVFGVCLNGISAPYMGVVQVWVTVRSGTETVVPGYYGTPQSRPVLFPNPANDYVDVANDAYVPTAPGSSPVVVAPTQVTVYNGQGTVVYSAANVTDPVLRLATQSWPGGLYQVTMQSGGTLTRQQLSIEH